MSNSISSTRETRIEHRPSLDTLKLGQREVRTRINTGVPTREDVLHLCCDVMIQSFGYCDPQWMRWVGTTNHVVAAFVSDEDRRDQLLHEETTLSNKTARDIRVSIYEEEIDPWFADAITYQSKKATQYEKSGKDKTLPDAERQEAPGMRPALADLDRQQRAVLDALIAGFESEDALRDWVPELRQATEYLLPRGFTSLVTRHPHYTQPLVAGDEFRHWRMQFACVRVLPLFVYAVRRVVGTATEFVEESGTKHTPTRGY